VPALGQSVALPSDAPAAVPENGFVSASQYTNAFFGFSLPLPKDRALGEFKLSLNRDTSRHFLFGLQSQKVTAGFFGVNAKLTFLAVTAQQSNGASSEEARKAAAGPKGLNVTRTEICGREFWKSESQQKVPEGKMRSVGFATALNGYVLQFNIESFDAKLTDQFQRSVEGLTCFDPAKAKDIAGPDSREYNPAGSDYPNTHVVPSGRIPQLNPGSVSGHVYRNEELGFRYEFPAGWVVNDKPTQEKVIEAGHRFVWGSEPSAIREHELAQQCTKILLLVTREPAGTRTEQLNPLIVVMAVDPACAPGAHFPKSVDDREAIQQVAKQMLRSIAGIPIASQEKAQVRAFTTEEHLVIEASQTFILDAPAPRKPWSAFTSIDLVEAKDYWLAWMFEGGSEAELRELKSTKIFFPPSATTPAARP